MSNTYATKVRKNNCANMHIDSPIFPIVVVTTKALIQNGIKCKCKISPPFVETSKFEQGLTSSRAT
ncbi:Serine/threonine protein kinase [Plasmodium coatneyi]|uniref:Serine/threonine protein kinase n=1 Tax=Plasmodium coatneyi TaxID=208452 RepID=A0A1B1E3H6_9APIC|nr:Serine/threonine protein kinase [Plasmodium coatneyi]ANQ09554.1 Serine/threonine protein kinase [Plasmodium coatneyi]